MNPSTARLGLLGQARDVLTRSCFNHSSPAIPDSIEHALKLRVDGRTLAITGTADLPNDKKLLSRVKLGHVLGLPLFIASLFSVSVFKRLNISDRMKETLDGLSKTGLLGSVGSFLIATFDKNIAEVNKAGLLDTLVTRYEGTVA